MLSIQKSPTDKTGLGYVASSSDAPSSSKTVFVKPTVLEPTPTVEDKGKDKVNDDVLGTLEPHFITRPSICSSSVLPPESIKGQSQERSAQTSSSWH
jgi:hypothetical protein